MRITTACLTYFGYFTLGIFGLPTGGHLVNAEELTGKEPVSLQNTSEAPVFESKVLEKDCLEKLGSIGKKSDRAQLEVLCSQMQELRDCKSVKGSSIFHFDKIGTGKSPLKILVLSLIHGDEKPSAMVSKSWMNRLLQIEPRNHWRIIPVLNPDGLHLNSRTNANKVDLNRNFPTKDWSSAALKNWEEKTKKDPRRFPGFEAASEPETRCALSHIEKWKPDLIVSLHTPYGVLDFDGPQLPLPDAKILPWVYLGHFPGSLGRYMWHDQQVPVLTIEMKGTETEHQLDRFDQIQDLIGQLALNIKSPPDTAVNKKAAIQKKKVRKL